MSHWYNQTFRKVHLLYVSPQWALRRGEKFDAEAYADGYAKADVDLVQVYTKDHHGVCYYPCSLGLPYPRDIIGEIHAALKARGIRMMAYVSMFFDNYAAGVHPDWRAVNEAGDPHKTGPFAHLSICSPYQAFLLTQLRELVARYDADGYWLDIIPLARHLPQKLWMIQPHPVPDYSIWAQRRYREATGRNLPKNPTSEEMDAIFEFMTGEVDAFMNRAYQCIRAERPEAVITYNAAGAPGDPLDSADLISIEGHAPHYARQSFVARWAKGQAKPFEMMTAGGLSRTEVGGGWNAFDQKPATLLELEAAIVLAHGGNPVIGHVPFPDGSVEAGPFETLGKVFPRIKALEPWLTNAAGVSDIGLVLASKPRIASAHWLRMKDGAEAAHRALIDEHLQYDIVRLAGEDLAKYEALMLIEQSALSAAEVERLRDYVAKGGTLIAAGFSSLFDEHGKPRPDFGLSDVYGASFRGPVEADFIYLYLDDDRLKRDVTPVPILVDSVAVSVSTSAKVLGRILEPESWRADGVTVLWGDSPPDPSRAHAGVIEHAFGRGRCRYVAFTPKTDALPNIWIKQLLRSLGREAVRSPVVSTNAPSGVEITLNRQRDRLILHAVNHHAGDPERLSIGGTPLTLRGINVAVDCSKAIQNRASSVWSLPDRAALPATFRDDRAEFALPDFSVHCVVSIE